VGHTFVGTSDPVSAPPSRLPPSASACRGVPSSATPSISLDGTPPRALSSTSSAPPTPEHGLAAKLPDGSSSCTAGIAKDCSASPKRSAAEVASRRSSSSLRAARHASKTVTTAARKPSRRVQTQRGGAPGRRRSVGVCDRSTLQAVRGAVCPHDRLTGARAYGRDRRLRGSLRQPSLSLHHTFACL